MTDTIGERHFLADGAARRTPTGKVGRPAARSTSVTEPATLDGKSSLADSVGAVKACYCAAAAAAAPRSAVLSRAAW